jgi:primosomal protein N' (replication factor Y)
MSSPDSVLVTVLVELPRHSPLDAALLYRSPRLLPPGTLVRVPLGKRLVAGLVWQQEAEAPPPGTEVREVAEVLDALPPLDDAWRDLLAFAAAYYQRSVGELALSVLPPGLRDLDGTMFGRRLKRLHKRLGAEAAAVEADAEAQPTLSAEQAQVLAAIDASPAATHLVHGVTGSGKTEVYLRAAEAALAAGRQVLVLVPEINLTPQLEARFARRFPAHRQVSLHSGLTPAQRLQHWLAAHLGEARLVLGTRMAVFASLPQLGLIVVDEEHDPSYKQQEGARYSARDLAVYRGRRLGCTVLLGSATPSLETWVNARGDGDAPAANARYRYHAMTDRIGHGRLPSVRLLDLAQVTAQHGRQAMRDSVVAPPLMQAMRARLAAGEQSLVLLNRRGYAPVLHCTSCGWKSDCTHCSAWRVFHKSDRTLRCHHCGFTEPVPRACPVCKDPDIQPLGRGTERVEEQLAAQLPGARVRRIDADTTRLKGALEQQLADVHSGEVDVLVGTQIVAKGHDFRRVSLVVAVHADAALFCSEFRAPERLFSLLMQAAGRAGRDAAFAERSEMWVQTWNPAHPLYTSLVAHDFDAFAKAQLAERRSAGLPPYAHLALVRAEARTQSAAQAFLHEAAAAAEALGAMDRGVMVYPPVPASMQKVADVERAQMLIEAPQRRALQALLEDWQAPLKALAAGPQRVLRWAIDVDPLSI